MSVMVWSFNDDFLRPVCLWVVQVNGRVFIFENELRCVFFISNSENYFIASHPFWAERTIIIRIPHTFRAGNTYVMRSLRALRSDNDIFFLYIIFSYLDRK